MEEDGFPEKMVFNDEAPCDFFLWGFINDRVFVSPLPATLVDLHITAAITVIDHDMLQRVWQELDYWLDVCYGWSMY
jgi:hypothetical protein